MTTSLRASPLKLIQFIRFQLDQLNSKNGQFDFEHLCRHFARETITSNILPATGPVSAGGDQGRDFETFTTFITDSDSALFFGRHESKSLVFACSLYKKSGLKNKIKSDIQSICSGSKPYLIYFFSNQDIPVALRHELQKWCLDEFQLKLEIIDAQALSEQLSHHNLFWIAEEYLRIPADQFPRNINTNNPAYESARATWFESKKQPYNFADFVEIKLALRKATFQHFAKPDLSRWIELMESFINIEHSEELRRRSVYEVCVAALRGQHNLTTKKKLVELYFTNWGTPSESSEIRDATILLSYCSSATLIGEFDCDLAQLHEWSKLLIKQLHNLLSKTTAPNTLTELLQTRAHAAHLPFVKSTIPQYDVNEIFKWWERVISSAKKSPLFPVEDFADLLTKVAPYIGDDQRFSSLMRKLDKLLEDRSKGYLIAEKSHDRAFEFIKAGKTLQAIDDLHRAKVRWFTGDTIYNSLLSLMTLSECYLQLGLCYAAKYHALGAVFLIAKSTDDEIRSLFTSALYQLCSCEYVSGEWMTFSERFPFFLSMHYHHEQKPDDWAEDKIQGMVFHFLIIKSLAKAMGGSDAVAKVESPLRTLNMPDDLREEILNPPLPLEKYENMAIEEILSKTSEEIWGAPFTDCGPTRIYRWKALGISWFASTENRLSDLPYAEEFIAVLQIVIADFGRTDFCLLPTNVELELIVWSGKKIRTEETPDNKSIAFKIFIPKVEDYNHKSMQETQSEILAVASTILFWCSALPDSEIKKKLASSFKNELSSKVFLVRPYWELFLELTSGTDFKARRLAQIGIFDRKISPQRESKEIGWIDTPGYGYSNKKAHEFIQNRYRRAIAPIRKTLVRLRSSSRFNQWVSDLRCNGYLDWQILLILSSHVVNFRVNLINSTFHPEHHKVLFMEIVNREESDTDPYFHEELLYDSKNDFAVFTSLIATTSTWGLQIRRDTPDIEAIKRLMDVRYFQSTDDIPHEDIFAPLN
jgi:hypothetical protein